MLRILALLFFTISLFADIKTDIIKVQGEEATITPVDAPLGVSGIVIHRFDKDHATIVARAILRAKDRVSFEVYDALAQEALPKPKITPQPKDEVILEYLYNRGIIIAPNLELFNLVKSNHPDITWLHPDLFATELSKEKNPAPTPKDFKNFCNKFAVGVVYIARSGEGTLVDCYTFAPLKKESLPKATSYKLPFYSRIKEIESSLFSFFGHDEITGYDSYYKTLLEKR